ncbi:MAG: VCBS repeat-containing protein [Candidatus Handelsmanbacteria bacterium]|nr:VCBS repeat-containing protein [Candidatus Handelsmanbacteria bacterium]
MGHSAGLDRTGGTGTAWADYDNDGDLDLYVADYASANGLYRNLGDGTFAKAGLNPGESVIAAAWGDYDNDGDLDLYVVRKNSPNLLYQNNGNGTFTETSVAQGVDDSGQGEGTAWAATRPCGSWPSTAQRSA